MSNLSKAIETIGRDIGEIQGKQSSLLTTDKAYSLFPTYNNFVKLVVEQSQWMPDPFVFKSQLPTSDIDELKQKVAELENEILEIKRSIQS
jgi:hypothetical protein